MAEQDGQVPGGADEQGEEAESQALQQILQICQSSQDASGYQQIASIVQQLIAHNQQEEQEMGGAEGGEGSDMANRVMERIQKNRGEKNA